MQELHLAARASRLVSTCGNFVRFQQCTCERERERGCRCLISSCLLGREARGLRAALLRLYIQRVATPWSHTEVVAMGPPLGRQSTSVIFNSPLDFCFWCCWEVGVAYLH